MIPRTVKTIYEGAGVKGIKRAPKEVLERIVGKLNAVSDSRMRSKGMTPANMALEPRYTSNIQDVHAAITTGKATRPRVVMRDGEAFIVLHRGVSSGGKQALSGSKYQGKWGDVAQAPGFPASTHRGVAKIFAGDSPTKLRKQRSAVIAKSKSILEDPGSREYLHPNDRAYHEELAAISRGGIKRSPDLKPSSRGKMRLKKPRPNIGTYLLPESEIDSAWVRPQSVFGPEWEVRHPQVGDHLVRNRKYFTAKLRLREFARGDYAIPALGKMLKDRSFLEEFMTGKRGPKLGDLSVVKIYPGGKISANPTRQGYLYGIQEGKKSDYFKKNRDSLSDVVRNVPLGIPDYLRTIPPPGLTAEQTAWAQTARTAARNNAAKMLRKGRAGGDVYEEIGRINPAARKQNDLSAKLRLRELARGDYAIPALGKMLKDRSFLEEFMTGKRGPKLGDLSVGKIFPGGKISAHPHDRYGIQEGKKSDYFKKNMDSLSDVVRNVPLGIPDYLQTAWAQTARTAARNNAAKMLRKGRAGGDVYEEKSDYFKI